MTLTCCIHDLRLIRQSTNYRVKSNVRVKMKVVSGSAFVLPNLAQECATLISSTHHEEATPTKFEYLT